MLSVAVSHEFDRRSLQVMGIVGAMTFVRFGLEPLVRSLRTMFRASGPWEKSSEYHILREVRLKFGQCFAAATSTLTTLPGVLS